MNRVALVLPRLVVEPKHQVIHTSPMLFRPSLVAFLVASSSSSTAFSPKPLSTFSVVAAINNNNGGSSSSGRFGVSDKRNNPSFCKHRLINNNNNNNWIVGGDTSTSIARNNDLFRYMSSATDTEVNEEVLAKMTDEANKEVNGGEDKSMSIAGKKLTKLRQLMNDVGVDVYVVPSDDPHLSEYVSDAYARRAYISDFKGSAGTAVITSDKAYLWTDSRYYNEASMQLDSTYWTLMKAGLPKTPTIPKFLADLAVEERTKDKTKELKIGLDPFVHPASFAKEVDDAMTEASDTLDSELQSEDIALGSIDTLDEHGNLVDSVWSDSRPSIPTSPFRVHSIEYAGITVEEKVKLVRNKMLEEKATLCVLPALDEIAYFLNLRAKGDVDCNPVGISYCSVSNDSVTLYCDIEHKISDPAVRQHLEESGVTLAAYDNIVSDIEAHVNESPTKKKVWIDKSMCNLALARCVPTKQLIDKQNPIRPMKSIKNDAELEGMRRAHIVDGVAMAKFMSWLENEVVNEGRQISEVEVDEKLTGERAKQEGFVEVSFPTIAGVGPNGAIIHYRAYPNDIMKYLDTTNPILIDSGGQYLYGTTDVTRTWHFGEATEEFKDCYTRVLKGHIGLDTLIWPENTPGFAIDLMARKSLWEVQKDYGHGTGHGVGAALNVHEGPQSISPRWLNKEPLKAGMIVSNEPGYYVDGKFGIRIENLVHIEELPTPNGVDDDSVKKFLQFKPLTVIPIQKNLMKQDIMSNEEMDWVDNYHDFVWNTVGPLLEQDTSEYKWLQKSCEKLERIV